MWPPPTLLPLIADLAPIETPVTDWMRVNAEWLLPLAGVVGALAAAVSAFVKASPRFRSAISSLWNRVMRRREERLARRVEAAIAPVLTELRPNGGTSFSDRVDRRLESIEEWQRGHEARHDEYEGVRR